MRQAPKNVTGKEALDRAFRSGVSFGHSASSVYSFSGNDPSILEVRILNALEILARKLQRNRLEVVPIYEMLELELSKVRNSRDVIERAELFLHQRQKASTGRGVD